MIYTSESEVIALVEAFHKRTLSPTKWDHSALLTVTLYYGIRFPYAVAFDFLRDGMQWVTLNPTLATRTQHDSAIHFWLQTVKSFAIKYRNIDDLSALANILIATHKESAMPYNYSREGVFEADAAFQSNTSADPSTIEVTPLNIAAAA